MKTRERFKVPGLHGLAAIIAILVVGVLLLIRSPSPTKISISAQPNSDVIMEGVDINSNGAGRREPSRQTIERHRVPRELFPPELHNGE